MTDLDLWGPTATLEFITGLAGLGVWVGSGLLLLVCWYVACRWGWPWNKRGRLPP